MVAKPADSPRPAGITHVLLAVDGSPASIRAAERLARLLPAYPDARITVLYVAHLPRDLQMCGEGAKLIAEFPLHGLVRATAPPALEAATRALGPLARRAATEVQIGEPDAEICEYAAAEGVDLIVMGLQGHGSEGSRVGSVAAKVLTKAPCPVMLVQ